MARRSDFTNKHGFGSGLASRVALLIPGIALCALVTLTAIALQAAGEFAFGQAYVEAIVIAILLGTAIRTIWEPGSIWTLGIAF